MKKKERKKLKSFQKLLSKSGVIRENVYQETNQELGISGNTGTIPRKSF